MGIQPPVIVSQLPVSTLDERIRRARILACMTQSKLAMKVGVKRGAVAQWEKKRGSCPSLEHLVAIALHTQVHLEWLGTGRGPVQCEQPLDDPSEHGRVQCAVEIQWLCLLRR